MLDSCMRPHFRAICLLVAFISLLLCPAPIAADDPPAAAKPPAELPPITEITQDTTLDPAKSYGRLVIKASNVTIDGRGAKLIGAKTGAPKSFKGNGIFAEGVNNVTLKNVRVQGFETGLKVVNAEGWTIEGCDFSNNFHDPDFGWGEQG